MLKELLELTKTTETVSDNAVEGVEGKVVNYDCDPMCLGAVTEAPGESVRDSWLSNF